MTMPTAIKERKEAAEAQEAADLAAIAAAEKAAQDGQQTPVEESTPVVTAPVQPVVAQPAPQPVAGQDAGAIDALKAEVERLKTERAEAEQRWRSAQGILKAGNQDNSLKAMKDELAELKKMLADSKPKENAAFRHVKPEYRKAIEEAGGELPPEYLMAKGEIEASAESFNAKLEAQMAEIKAMKDELMARDTEREQSASWNGFMSQVESAAPGFTAENNTAGSGWTKFLDLSDPKTGMPYRKMAEYMAGEGNAKGIVALFNEYKAMSPGGDKARSLESLVKPETGKSAPAPKTEKGPQHTFAEYEHAYKQLRPGQPLRKLDGTVIPKEGVAAYMADYDEWFNREQMKAAGIAS